MIAQQLLASDKQFSFLALDVRHVSFFVVNVKHLRRSTCSATFELVVVCVSLDLHTHTHACFCLESVVLGVLQLYSSKAQ